ncbi:MAG TPA: phosphomannomutase/phosphoglucomutase [Candidatus Peribacteraceae bacterium]|nr:MAG: hypothetical protein A2635_01805 [Candidatus Peribacteria bacterium RIFCSPHIGHO2_01_FULL_51_9]HLD71773.1 phosphomannomutase/phosphoglucomutase [Candidatus Peribacteraceae bacterium]
MIDPHIFRAYDIRGKADSQITEEACEQIGHAFGTVLRERYKKDHPTVAVGRDARTHGPKLEQALRKGLMKAGCHLIFIGQTPSPVNYFTICNLELDGGVQVTASHNPADDNGLKLQLREAEAYAGEDLQDLRKRIEQKKFLNGTGKEETIDAVAAYEQHLLQLFPSAGNGLKIVVDGGNGVAGKMYSEVLRKSGAEIIELFTEPDGTFPNHPADPSKWETLKDLQSAVLSHKANAGFAYDGDGDRLGIVDETGKIRSADDILLMLAEDHLERNPGAAIVFTVSNSSALETEITKWGGDPLMCKVGHSFVEHAMRERGALLGGEQSGHFFCFENYYGFDDALVASLHMLSIMRKRKESLSSILQKYPKVYQAPERRPYCPDDQKTGIIERITKHFEKSYPVVTLDGARVDFGDGAWAGIRQSNTSPCLSICLEARSEAKLKEVEIRVLDHLKTYPAITL